MFRAWYLNYDASLKPREENHRSPPKFVTIEDLHKLTGVEFYQIDIEAPKSSEFLEKFKKERGYDGEDEMITGENLKAEVKNSEHLHEYEESRLVLDGSGFYDFRDAHDEWIRIVLLPGFLVVVPSGCFHRFMFNHSNFIKVKRLFLKGVSYEAFERPDELEARKAYLKKLREGSFKQQ